MRRWTLLLAGWQVVRHCWRESGCLKVWLCRGASYERKGRGVCWMVWSRPTRSGCVHLGNRRYDGESWCCGFREHVFTILADGLGGCNVGFWRSKPLRSLVQHGHAEFTEDLVISQAGKASKDQQSAHVATRNQVSGGSNALMSPPTGNIPRSS